jgi:hypothetical protein
VATLHLDGIEHGRIPFGPDCIHYPSCPMACRRQLKSY